MTMERLTEWCASNNMIIGGTIFQHCDFHKLTWTSPNGRNQNQIEHLMINSMWSNVRGENLRVSLKDIIVGIFDRNDLSIWECRRNKSLTKFNLLLHKVEAKKDNEKLIALRNKGLLDFRKKMGTLTFLRLSGGKCGWPF